MNIFKPLSDNFFKISDPIKMDKCILFKGATIQAPGGGGEGD